MFFVGALKVNVKKCGSGSTCQRHGSADPDPEPDPHQNVMDPQHCFADRANILAAGYSGPLHWLGLIMGPDKCLLSAGVGLPRNHPLPIFSSPPPPPHSSMLPCALPWGKTGTHESKSQVTACFVLPPNCLAKLNSTISRPP
jgi:hypothetical protein